MEHLKIKKRFWFLIILTLVMVVASITYTLVMGKTYTLKMDDSVFGMVDENDVGIDVSILRTGSSDESVVRIDDAFIQTSTSWSGGGYIAATVSAVGEGDAIVMVYLSNEPENPYAAKVHVDSFGTVYYIGTVDRYAIDSNQKRAAENGVYYAGDLDRLEEAGIHDSHILHLKMNFNGYQLVQAGIIVYLVVVLIVMVLSFAECWRKAKFSYQMIAYGGVAAFCAAMVLYMLYNLMNYADFYFFLKSMLDTGELFLFFAALLVVPLFSLLLIISNIRLITREGFRPQNMLGIIISLLLFAMNGFVLYGQRVNVLNMQNDIWNIVVNTAAYITVYLECLLGSTILCAFLSKMHRPKYFRDYLIILGCGIRKDGTLTPILRGRVDAAVQYERQQFAATGRHAKFVPSGGQGADEVISESEAMKRYLMEQGYPEEQIVTEDRSVNTYQNIAFSKQAIERDNGTSDGVKAAFATTNYHIFRGYILSKKHQLDAEGISAKTKWYFYPNAFLREFAGLLVDQKYKIALFMLMIAAAVIVSGMMLSM